jgi:Tfp pilus assembly protein PilV
MKRAVPEALRWRRRPGISLVEVVVALMLLAGGMLAVTSAGSAVIGQLKVSRTEVQLWGALQTVGDSLQQLGYGNATSCVDPIPCRVIADRYNFFWSVDTGGPTGSDPTLAANLNRITLVGWVCDVHVTLCGAAEPSVAPLRDERVLIYLADLTPPPAPGP